MSVEEPDTYYLVIDNTDYATPSTGHSVTVQTGYVALTPVGERSGLGDFLRTLFLQQDYWELSFVTAVGIAGPTLIFLLIAIPCALVAQNDATAWWGVFTLMVILGGALTIVTPEGFLFNTRILTIPAAFLGYWTYRRTTNTVVSAASVFSATLFGGFVGVDVLNEIMHHSENVQRFYYEGVIGVFGGAGWSDGLIFAPLSALVTFGAFRIWMRHARLSIGASLEGTTTQGTLYIKIYNVGEHLARNIHLRVLFDGDSAPATVVEEGLLASSLQPQHELAYHIDAPQAKAGEDAPWDRLLILAQADNAAEEVAVIHLTRS